MRPETGRHDVAVFSRPNGSWCPMGRGELFQVAEEPTSRGARRPPPGFWLREYGHERSISRLQRALNSFQGF